jgi:hypothetical protein
MRLSMRLSYASEQAGRPSRAPQCPLLGVKRTWISTTPMSAFDPLRTLHRAWQLPFHWFVSTDCEQCLLKSLF